MRHLEGNELLHPRQHGFRARRSCETQLVEFTHDLLKGIHEGKQVDVIIMDFAKAFDKVPHNRLLLKLDSYGVRGKTLQWIEAFLTDRRQQVVLDGVKSSEGPVTSGVPQGAVLAPALFLVFINDLPASVNSEVRLFADDTVLYRHITSEQDAHDLQADLDSLAAWEERWQMEFHANKCQVLRVRRSRSGIEHEYKLHGTSLPQANEVKYLGVTVTKDLRWNKHIAQVRSKASGKLAFLQRNIRISSPHLKEQLYKSLVRPTLEYASNAWDPHEQKLVYQLESVQRRAARWVLNRFHNTSSVTAMMNDLAWKSLEQRRTCSRLCTMYKIHHGLVAISPGILHLTNTADTRQTRSSHQNQYTLFQPRTNYYKYSFFPLTVAQWNLLNVYIQCSKSVNIFKTQVEQLEFARA